MSYVTSPHRRFSIWQAPIRIVRPDGKRYKTNVFSVSSDGIRYKTNVFFVCTDCKRSKISVFVCLFVRMASGIQPMFFVIAMANDSEFGLGSGVFTENLARAHRVSAKIRSGICWVNTYRAISPIAPFGGINQSGYGREAGMQSVQDYIRSKTTWINISDDPMANPFVMR